MKPPCLVLTLSLTLLSSFQAKAQKDCTPWDTGVGITTGSVHSPVVLWASWWCPPVSGIGSHTKRGYYIIPSYYPDMTPFHLAIKNKDKTWLTSQLNRPVDDPQGARSIDSPESLITQNLAKPPDAYPAYVAPNTASTSVPKTRPAYEVIQGVRGKEVARAVVGAGCNPTITNLTGGYMAYAPQFVPTIVTLCKARQ